jgi:translation elongation factor EF-Tu-like GTPase
MGDNIGDHSGLKEDVKRGQILCKPGSTRSLAKQYALKKDEGGPPPFNYRPRSSSTVRSLHFEGEGTENGGHAG